MSTDQDAALLLSIGFDSARARRGSHAGKSAAISLDYCIEMHQATWKRRPRWGADEAGVPVLIQGWFCPRCRVTRI